VAHISLCLLYFYSSTVRYLLIDSNEAYSDLFWFSTDMGSQILYYHGYVSHNYQILITAIMTLIIERVLSQIHLNFERMEFQVSKAWLD